MGYTLAAMVIEAVTRERYETWLDRELLRPLGMRDSTFAFTTQLVWALIHGGVGASRQGLAGAGAAGLPASGGAVHHDGA